MTTKTKTKKNQFGIHAISLGQTCSVAVTTKEDARAQFINRTKKDASCYGRAEAFCELMDDLTNLQQSFSFRDVVRESQGRNIQIDCLESLLADWLNVNERLNRVEKLESCYDFPIYRMT